MADNQLQSRILIVAPMGADGPTIAAMLRDNTLTPDCCHDLASACRLAEKGLGAMLITEEAFREDHLADFLQFLQCQPPWSDPPVIILTRGGEAHQASLLRLLDAGGNLSLMERPMQKSTLLAALRVALRARQRQYETRDLLQKEIHQRLTIAESEKRYRSLVLELRRNRRQLEAVFQSAVDGIVVAETSGNVVLVNEAMAKITGHPNTRDLKRDVSCIWDVFELRDLDGRLLSTAELPISRVLRGESLTEVELCARRKGEEQEWFFSFSGRPVRNDRGEQVLAVVITRDITQRKEAEEVLARSREELEHLVAERTRSLQETTDQLNAFCYSIAHDLRAPIRAQSAFAQALLSDFGEALGETGCNFARRIADAAERQGRLVTDLLAHMSLGRADLPMQEVDLRHAIDEARQELRLEIEQKEARVEVGGLNGLVLANPSSLHLVLTNLLSNALKFVPAGAKPEVRIWAEHPKSSVRLWIQDNGIGIPKMALNKVFGVFERLHPRELYPGTGMGLAIVKRAAERMGGRAGVESEEGKGSRFWVELKPGE